MRTRLTPLKILAVLVPLGALLLLGAFQRAKVPQQAGEAEKVPVACAQPSKIFHFTLNGSEWGSVSALRVRVAPEVSLSQVRFEPQPEEVVADRDGMLELRYAPRVLQSVKAVQLELCGATPMHEVREAYFIMREPGHLMAKLIDAERIGWQWRESGTQVVPGTRPIIKELSCVGEALVQPTQLIAQGEPICVRDPRALAHIQKQINDLQNERASFWGKLKALLFGEREYEERLTKLNEAMQRLYLRAPDQGMVVGVTYDESNRLTWIRLRVEEPTILVSP